MLVLGTVFDQGLEAVSGGGVDGSQGEVNEAGLDEPLGADLLLAGPVPGHLGGGALLPGRVATNIRIIQIIRITNFE